MILLSGDNGFGEDLKESVSSPSNLNAMQNLGGNNCRSMRLMRHRVRLPLAQIDVRPVLSFGFLVLTDVSQGFFSSVVEVFPDDVL